MEEEERMLARPSAAPPRTTMPSSDLHVKRRYRSSSSYVALSIDFTSEPSAFAAIWRISGEWSRIDCLMIGIRSPRYGDTSLGSETRLHMLPTIVAAFFLESAELCLRPRCTTGMRSASDGASTAFTNVVSITTSSALAVLSGLESDSRSSGAIARISGFLITFPTWPSAVIAPSRTLGWVSDTAFAMTGTIVGRHVPSWRGAQ
mmetsp:Transcript_21110/g.50936  ORF Transcript_21110/g.50936 Transcript_21110/m.50936 type:complete len:204 (-) Transcript_21110:3962-4573(-)